MTLKTKNCWPEPGLRPEGVEVEGEEPVGGELEEDWVDPALFLSQILNSHLK